MKQKEQTKEKQELDVIKVFATEAGWKQGKHIFNYLSEVDMHRYDGLFLLIEQKKITKRIFDTLFILNHTLKLRTVGIDEDERLDSVIELINEDLKKLKRKYG